MKKTYTVVPQSYVSADSEGDYSEYYGRIAVRDSVKNSELVQKLISWVETGTMNGYDEWGAMNFLGGYLRNEKVYIKDVEDAIIEVWYNHPEIKNFDKLVRLGV